MINAAPGGDGRYPEAHTCFFTLDLPDYSSVDETYRMLVHASYLAVGVKVNLPPVSAVEADTNTATTEATPGVDPNRTATTEATLGAATT